MLIVVLPREVLILLYCDEIYVGRALQGEVRVTFLEGDAINVSVSLYASGRAVAIATGFGGYDQDARFFSSFASKKLSIIYFFAVFTPARREPVVITFR